MNEEEIRKYKCIHLADRRDSDKLCRAIEELKQYKDREQKLIDKLEDDIERSYCDGKYEGNFRMSVWKDEYAEEILEIVKGEKNG